MRDVMLNFIHVLVPRCNQIAIDEGNSIADEMKDLNIAATARNKEMSSSSQQEFHTFAQYQAGAKAKAKKMRR